MTQFPSVFGNALAEGNQNNLQQQIPQTSYVQPAQGKPMGSFNHQQNTNICQPARNGQTDYGLVTNGLYTNHQQQIQQPIIDSCSLANPHSSSLYYNNCCVAGSAKQTSQPLPMPTLQGYSFLPQNILDQIRSCTTNSSPIFILPNGTSNNNMAPTCPVSILPSTCIPYPMPLPIFQSSDSKAKENECKCSSNNARNNLTEICEKREKAIDVTSKGERNCESCTDYCYKQNIRDVVCSKQNCPASIQLQAIVSQLLGIQGIISSTITRLLLKRIPSSNITDSAEEIMQWATRGVRKLTKDQLLKESKNSHEVNGLLRLYLTSSSTLARIIPILTTAQLKSNILKSLVESLINAKIMEDQGYGAEDPEPLDVFLLELKTGDELRQLLSVLREKECQERVNLSFAAYNSQRLIAESRLTNVQKKIGQIEKEMDRRYSNGTDQDSCKKTEDLNFYKINCDSFDYNKPTDLSDKNFISPDPFLDVYVPNPRKLLLKPHVGSPETTYTKPNDTQKSNSINSKTEQDDRCSSFCVKKCNEETTRNMEFLGEKNPEERNISSEIRTRHLLKSSITYTNNENITDINCKNN